MAIFATAGSKLYIGGPMEPAEFADLVASDFTAVTWTEIAPLESIGSVGDTSEEVTFDAIGQARTIKVKGTRNAGNMEISAGIDYANAGQIALLTAERTEHNYAFRLVFNDAPAGGTPSERRFVALVMGASESLDTANNVMKLTATLAVNSNIVRTAAAG